MSRFNQPGKLLNIPAPIPNNEADRTMEGNRLIVEIEQFGPEAWKELTTWEVQTILSIKEGSACTRIRLKELRDAHARLKTLHGDDKNPN